MTEIAVAQNTLSPLPLAEQLNTDLLLAERDILARKQLTPSNIYELACNNLEYGIATRSLETADLAFNVFNALTQHPQYSAGRLPYIEIHKMLAYEGVLRHRIQHNTPPDEATVRTMHRCLLDAITGLKQDSSVNYPQALGTLGQLVVFAGLARQENPHKILHPTTPREANDPLNPSTNHLGYAINTATQTKQPPIQIKVNRTSVALSSERRRRPIRHISVIPAIMRAMRPHPELLDPLLLQQEQVVDKRLHFISDLLVAETQPGQTLSNSEHDILGRFTKTLTERVFVSSEA